MSANQNYSSNHSKERADLVYNSISHHLPVGTDYSYSRQISDDALRGNSYSSSAWSADKHSHIDGPHTTNTYPLSRHNITIAKVPARSSYSQRAYDVNGDTQEDYLESGSRISTLPAYLRSKFDEKRFSDDLSSSPSYAASYRSEIPTFQVASSANHLKSSRSLQGFTNSHYADPSHDQLFSYNENNYNSMPRESTSAKFYNTYDDSAPVEMNPGGGSLLLRQSSLDDGLKLRPRSVDRFASSPSTLRTSANYGTPILVQHFRSHVSGNNNGHVSPQPIVSQLVVSDHTKNHISSHPFTSKQLISLQNTLAGAIYSPNVSNNHSAVSPITTKERNATKYSPLRAIVNIGLPSGGYKLGKGCVTNGGFITEKGAGVEEEVDELMIELMKNMGIAGKQNNSNACAKCCKVIASAESGCKALDQIFHVSCFICSKCSCLLSSSSFYAMDGEPFCEACYQGMLEKCVECQEVITDRLLRAVGNTYHPQCFRCVECQQSLDGLMFTVDSSSHVYCIHDFNRRYAPLCSACNEPIVPQLGQEEATRIVALDRSFHIECYTCQDCGLQLSSEADGRGCYPLDGSLLCKICNTRRLQSKTRRRTTNL